MPDEGREASRHGVRVGVDVGGTFTDVVAVEDGELTVRKVPSTPGAPDEGVIDGLEATLGAADHPPEAVTFLGHGTTVATNAVLEGTWADTALVTNEGFRDVLEIGRQDRPDLYDLTAEKPAPIVPRDRRFEVPGRLDERGRELEPIDESAVRSVAAEIAETDVGTVAVCLLFAFEDDAHERQVAEILAAETSLPVSRSSAVLPEIREYERSLATALNAALVPRMGRYLADLGDGLGEVGVEARPTIMQSSGGATSAETAREEPVRTLLSGPAGGVRGAAHVATASGYSDVLTMDMGGTSCDVSLVRGGEPEVSREVTVGDYPVRVPMVDVHTIGAGGGSIAWVDEGGALRVGPRSAGADPGPICYGRGGTEPTVTDAHYLLGRLSPERFAEGALDVERSAVEAGVREHVAEPLDVGVEEAARGVVDVANASMERALRVVSVERGHDPRALSLVAFGGAGPLHAAELAASLDVPRVLVPRAAGVLSALGLLVGDVLEDLSATRVRPWAEVDPTDLEERFAAFEAEGDGRLAEEGVPPEDRRFERALDVRYAGQAYELTVELPGADRAPLDEDDLAAAADRFHDSHEERFGHASPGEALELVAVRLRARGVVEPPELSATAGTGTLEDATRERRRVVLGDREGDAPVYDRDRLPLEASVDGPAVVEGSETTVVVPPGQRARIDERGTLVVEADGVDPVGEEGS